MSVAISGQNVQIINGNHAAALAARLCRVQVISAYPITPQSPLSETLSRFVESGDLAAEYVPVESEHSAMAVVYAASLVGARTFTATSSHGLAYMHEMLHWVAGSRLPVVMACANRAVGAPWSILNDQQDSISQRDTGWVQIYARDNQEIIDSIIQAYKIAEALYVPVMVCFDGFILSHTNMPVDIPGQKDVDAFLPSYKPHTTIDPASPRTYNAVTLPNPRADAKGVLRYGYMEFRQLLHQALEDAAEKVKTVDNEFAQVFGRSHGGMVWDYRLDDADVVLVAMGSLGMEATVTVDSLRDQGCRAGLLGIRVFRPFPKNEVAQLLRQARTVVVFEKDISYGYEGAVCSDLKAALYGSGVRADVCGYIVGLGGRDVKARELEVAVQKAVSTRASGQNGKAQWLGYL